MDQRVLEVAELTIKENCVSDFLEGVKRSLPLFEAATGFEDLRLVRSIEDPLTFRLMIHWASLEDHTETFRNSPAFASWRENVGEFFASPPRVDHSNEVVSN